MIITCPNCSSRYNVTPESIGASGRRVRCQKCEHQWDEPAPSDLPIDVEPEPPMPEPTPPPPEPEDPYDKPRGIEEAAEDDAMLESYTFGKKKKKKKKGMSGAKIGAIIAVIFLLLLIGTGVGAYVFKRDIVLSSPSTASLYKAIGLGDDLVGLGLKFDKIRNEYEFESGALVMVIKGDIINVLEQPVPIPRIRVGIRDKQGQEIYFWTVAAPQPELEGDGITEFETRLPSPPENAARLDVTFTDEE